MTVVFINDFIVFFWALFIFIKSVNQKPTAKIIITQLVFSGVFSALISLISKLFLPEIIIIFVFGFCCVFNKVIVKNKWDVTITISVIACAFSYVLYGLSAALVSFVFSALIGGFNGFYLIPAFICVFFIMGLLVFRIFKIKRLKRGFPFLNEKHISLLGVTIALVVFQCYTVIMAVGEFDNLVWFLLFGIAICAVLIIIWWRTGITKIYRDSLFIKENEELNREVAEKDGRIAEIEKDNAALSKIIHSDNKLLPALENAVKELCENYSEQKADEIAKELTRVFAERKGLINRYKKDSKRFESTRIIALDITLDYMKQRAYEHDIEFDVFVSGNIKYMTEFLIPEEQLRKITADLLENAIIAVKPCDYRQILFTIGICDGYYEIRVEDSGIDFETETLRDLGKKQTTTHKDEGGSGLGMLELFDVMRESGASLIIKRLTENPRGFTKRISVRFDGNNEYIADY